MLQKEKDFLSLLKKYNIDENDPLFAFLDFEKDLLKSFEKMLYKIETIEKDNSIAEIKKEINYVKEDFFKEIENITNGFEEEIKNKFSIEKKKLSKVVDITIEDILNHHYDKMDEWEEKYAYKFKELELKKDINIFYFLFLSIISFILGVYFGNSEISFDFSKFDFWKYFSIGIGIAFTTLFFKIIQLFIKYRNNKNILK